MAVPQHTGHPEFACPACGGSLAFEHQSWRCTDCDHAPRHGAD